MGLRVFALNFAAIFALNIAWVSCVSATAGTIEVKLNTENRLVSGPFLVEVEKSRADIPLTDKQISVYNGKVTSVEDAGKQSKVWVQPYQEGEVAVQVATPIPPKRRMPKNWDSIVKYQPSEFLRVQYQTLNIPQVQIFGPKKVAQQEFEVAVSFSESITALTKHGFIVTNGEATGLSGQGRHYHLTVKAKNSGAVSIQIPQGAVIDTDGDQLKNAASELFTTQVAFSGQDQWHVASSEEWRQALDSSSQVTIKQGELYPKHQQSIIRSQFFKPSSKQKAKFLQLEQSPVWDNWTPAGNVGPDEAGDALVFVPAGDNNYYILGRHKDRRRQYDAWHSTDMKTWVNKGPVTPEGAKWVTTAEYKDGLYYIYFDHPNDEDPALIIDKDLSDGIPGYNLGTVFEDPSHGSDISIFRDDADDRFHLIYEDWSPIKANTHAYDSPLAGHTSSFNGIHGFEAHSHQPPVDHRTPVTDEYDTYFHGTTKASRIYRKHQGKQDAYGDWTSIKIGGQYYLFSDYDSYDQNGKRQPMQTARFTSDSLFKEFKLMGALGEGHPDPTVGFAEDQFYLITQRSQDFVSPGPWVDGVSARVGVDINGNGEVDQWTKWQSVKETYRQKPGYLRIVDKTPAQIPLSELPAGEQFKFEIRIDDSVTKDVTPLITASKMTFEAAE